MYSQFGKWLLTIESNILIYKAQGTGDNVSKVTAGQSQTVVAATVEQLASIEEKSMGNHNLVTMAQELEQTVQNSKLDKVFLN